MFPSECMFHRRVRSDSDGALADHLLFILECKVRKADGYADDQVEIYNERLKVMNIGVHLAQNAPPAVSYLSILCARMYGEIIAVDKTVIVISLSFAGDGGRMSYLIYDAAALSLRLIAVPSNRSWIYTLSSNVSIARPRQGDAYALVHTGRPRALVHTGLLAGVGKVDSLCLWRPSSSSPPWSERKEFSFQDLIVTDTDTEFSFNGQAYWVDLLCGVSYCSCEALFGNNSGVVKFRFTPLPVEERGCLRSSQRVAWPVAYQTMGVVSDSFIRFVSIDGFQDHVKLKNRTVTMWKLLRHDQDKPWVEEHKFSMKTLWGFEGFGDVPKDLTPMYPLLSTKDTDILYLVLGECRENPYKIKFIPTNARYLLAVNMRRR